MGWEDDPPEWVRNTIWVVFIGFFFGVCVLSLILLGKAVF